MEIPETYHYIVFPCNRAYVSLVAAVGDGTYNYVTGNVVVAFSRAQIGINQREK